MSPAPLCIAERLTRGAVENPSRHSISFDMTTTTSTPAPRRTRSTAVAVLVAGTFFMELLDGTILATAAPAMGRDLGVDSAAVGVAITAYLVTLAVFIPVSGWITDRVGSRTVFAAAIALFTSRPRCAPRRRGSST